MAKDGPNIVSNSTAATFGNSPQKTGEPVDRLSIYSGKGLDFDGVSDYLVTPIWYHINSTAGNYTIACWVRLNSAPSNNYKAHWARDDGYIYHVPAGSLSNLSVRVRLAAPDGSWALQASSTEAQVLGVWARIVVTYEYGNEVKIYINGKLDSTHSVTSDLQTGYGIANIGGHGSSGNYGDMSLSDWQLWTGANSVWSLADVQYDYLNPEKLATENASTSLTISDLTRWHPMNDTGVTHPQTVLFDAANSGGLTSNYVSSPSFDSDSGWSLGTNWSISGGKLIGSANAANANLVGLGFEANFIYKVVYSITSYTSGEVRVTVAGGQSGTYRSGVGTYTEYLPAGSTGGNLTFRGNPSNSFTGEIDDLTVQKVKQGYHGTTTFFGDDKLGGNGGFDATSNWSVVSGSVGTEWTINDSSNSKAVHNTGTTKALRYTGSSGDLVNGTTYQVDFTIADRTAGSLTFAIGGAAASSSQTASGSIELTAGGSSNRIIDINPTSDFDGSIDSVTVKEVGIATGWTDANQQQYIPQTAFMDGCVKNIFDGSSSFVNFGSASALDDVFVGGATVSFWVYLDLDNDPSSNGGFIHKAGNGNFGWQIYVDNFTSSKYKFRFSQRWNNEDLIQEAHVLRSQRWNHIVVTYDASSKSNRATFYLNGSVQTFDVLSSSYDASDSTSITSDASQDLEIGRKDTSGTYQNMIMDDISIFSTELTESQVIALYNDAIPLNATESAASSNLIGYWKNNKLESTGKWEDLSTNNNHGTPTNLDDYIFFQQGVTANLCTQGYSNNIVHPSKGATYSNGVSDYMDLGRDIEIEGDFMVMFWFKGNPSDIPYLFGAGGDDYFRISDEDTLLLKMNDTNEVIDLESGTDIGVEQWHHIAITRTGASGTIKIYFDNVAQTTDTEESTETLKIRTLMRKGLGSGNYGKGMIDDFFVYDNFNENAINKNYKHGKSQHKNS